MTVKLNPDTLITIVRRIEAEGMQCNCDLDRWQPEASTGHTWVCDIHKAAIREGTSRRID